MQSDYAKFYSRSHNAVLRVYDESGNMIETQEQAGDFKVLDFCSPFATVPPKTNFRISLG